MLSIPFLRKYLGGLDESESDVLTELEAGVVADVQVLTGRSYQPEAEIVEYHDGTGETALELRCPVGGDGTVTLEVRQGGWGWYEVPSTYYEIQPHPILGISNIIRLTNTRFPSGVQSVRVTYTGGYGVDAEPAQIRTLVADWSGVRYRGRAGATTPGANDQAIPPSLAETIKRWKYPEASYQTRLGRA